MVKELTLACILAVQAHYGFPRETMFALLQQEGGRPGLVSRNSNGTNDYGPYQINDVNVPAVAEAFGIEPAAAKIRLRDDGCFNAWAAGYLLAQHWERTGDIWTAIGHYHSRTPRHADRYRGGVRDKVRGLYEPSKPSALGPGRTSTGTTTGTVKAPQ